MDPSTGRPLEIQPVASGWWKRRKRSSAGSSSADSQALNSSSSIPVSGEQQGVAAAAAAAAAAVVEGAAVAAGQPGDELLQGDANSEEGRKEVQVRAGVILNAQHGNVVCFVLSSCALCKAHWGIMITCWLPVGLVWGFSVCMRHAPCG
jgi:hypothetical protein